jgi:hypothetical protein
VSIAQVGQLGARDATDEILGPVGSAMRAVGAIAGVQSLPLRVQHPGPQRLFQDGVGTEPRHRISHVGAEMFVRRLCLNPRLLSRMTLEPAGDVALKQLILEEEKADATPVTDERRRYTVGQSKFVTGPHRSKLRPP